MIRLLLVTSISLFLASLSGCDKKKSSTTFDGGKGESIDARSKKTSNILAKSKDRKDAGEKPTVYELANVGVKNFDQINRTMARLTGVPKGEARNVFDVVKTSLPSKNNYALFTGAMQVSVVKLASEYCELAFQNNQRRAAILEEVETLYQGQLEDSFSPENRKQILDQFAKKFWVHQSNYSKSAATEKSMNELYDALVEGRANNRTESQRLIRATCVVYLSSAPVISI